MINAGCYRMVNTGTSWQHYENSDHRPSNLYAATKQAFEEILNFYATAYPLRVCSLHLSDTYGPNDIRPKLFGFLTLGNSREELCKNTVIKYFLEGNYYVCKKKR